MWNKMIENAQKQTLKDFLVYSGAVSFDFVFF